MQPQQTLFSPLADVDFFRHLLADLYDDLSGKVARFRQLADLSTDLGSHGSMIFGGEAAHAAWMEARSSFVHGNFVATVMLCQGLAEHMLAAQLSIKLSSEPLPLRVSFQETLRRCVADAVISEGDAEDLRRLMRLRNPLSHYRSIDDESSLSRRALDSQVPAQEHLLADATFAISMAVRLLSLPSFRVDRGSLDD